MRDLILQLSKVRFIQQSRGEGNERVTSTHRTQQEAIDAAQIQSPAIRKVNWLFIDQMDKSEIETPHGKNPFPIKDEK